MMVTAPGMGILGSRCDFSVDLLQTEAFLQSSCWPWSGTFVTEALQSLAEKGTSKAVRGRPQVSLPSVLKSNCWGHCVEVT